LFKEGSIFRMMTEAQMFKRYWVDVDLLGVSLKSRLGEFKRHIFSGGTVYDRVKKLFFFLYLQEEGKGEVDPILYSGTEWKIPTSGDLLKFDRWESQKKFPSLKQMVESKMSLIFGGIKRGPSRLHTVRLELNPHKKESVSKISELVLSDLLAMRRRRGVYLLGESIPTVSTPSLLTLMRNSKKIEEWKKEVYPEEEVIPGIWVYSERQFREILKELILCLCQWDLVDIVLIVMDYIGKKMNYYSNPVQEAAPVVLFPRDELQSRYRTIGAFPITLWKPSKKGSPVEMGYQMSSLPLIVSVGTGFEGATVSITEDVPALQSSCYSIASTFVVQKCAQWLQVEFRHWRILSSKRRGQIEGRLFWIVVSTQKGWAVRPFTIVSHTKRGQTLRDPLRCPMDSVSTDICFRSKERLWDFGFCKIIADDIRRGCECEVSYGRGDKNSKIL